MVVMLLSLVFFLLIIIPNAFSLSFNFSSFNPNDKNISYEGSSYPASQSIQLTRNQQDENSTSSVGRATYHQPMQLWDKATGNLTDFTSHFTFVISSQKDVYGDGLAFFLAPAGSKLPATEGGGSLGLTLDDQTLNSKDNPFVAVEFDIYSNDWDPPKEHVGININSMRSVDNLTWLADIKGGRINEAFISYESDTQKLSILFIGFLNGTIVQQHLNEIIDLRKYLPERVTFGFSAATGSASAIHKVYSWNFTSKDLVKTIINPSPSPSLSASPKLSQTLKRRKPMTKLEVGIGIGGFVLICGLGVVLFVIWKKIKKMKEGDLEYNQMSKDFERVAGPKQYTYAELASAANYFKEEQKLGQGGFGGVYKGFLKDSNTHVAIKKVSKSSTQGIKEFASEVRIISQLRHRNLVKLIGWCHEREELLLVYEYMPNGSLDFHLFKNQRLLTWSERFQIVQGLASVISYLHEDCESCVVHRDIKSSNIMLDSNFNAKIGDFGLARVVDHTESAKTTTLAGTFGYMAPEYVVTGKASKQSDIYSFGVVLLEIACGRRPINVDGPQNEVNIVNWVWKLYGSGRILEAVDSRLQGDSDQDQVKCLMIVGLWCAHPNRDHRPSMRQAIQVLRFESPFPSLPSSYPGPAYHEPPMRLSS